MQQDFEDPKRAAFAHVIAELRTTYVHPADPRRDNDPEFELGRMLAAADAHGAGVAHDPGLCGIPHPGTPEHAAREKRRREDFREPGYALARFTESQLLPGYGQASGLRCFMFTTAAVYAATREDANAFADAHELRGPRAREYHAELS